MFPLYNLMRDFYAVPSYVSQRSLISRQLIEEQEQAALEFRMRRLAQLQQIAQRPLPMLPPIGVSMDEFRASNGAQLVIQILILLIMFLYSFIVLIEIISHADHLNFQPTEPLSSAPLIGNFNTDSSNRNLQKYACYTFSEINHSLLTLQGILFICIFIYFL